MTQSALSPSSLASRDDGLAAFRLPDWLGLAAAPTFAAMALLTGVFAGSAPDMLCGVAEHASPLAGMMPMYLLMTAFHLPPWLRLIAGQRKRRES
jgi:hypothetical protein